MTFGRKTSLKAFFLMIVLFFFTDLIRFGIDSALTLPFPSKIDKTVLPAGETVGKANA